MKQRRVIEAIVVVSVAAIGAVAAFTWYRFSLRNAQCAENLRQLGASLRIYANESKGEYYPPLSKVSGRMMFDREAVYPTYLPDPMRLVSPFHPDYETLRNQDVDPEPLLDDGSYWYLGYIFANERSALAWIDTYKKVVPDGQLPADVDAIWPEFQAEFEARDKEVRARYEEEMAKIRADWIASGNQGEPPGRKMLSRAAPYPHERHIYYALREGIERFLIKDIGNPYAAVKTTREAPVMVERPELHGNGGHVLFLDGHVEFVPYPGPFPMTEAFIEGLRSLERFGKP